MTTNSIWQARFDKLTAFQRGSLKAKSLGNQREYLKLSRKALISHDVSKAKMWLKAWEIERMFYKQLCGEKA